MLSLSFNKFLSEVWRKEKNRMNITCRRLLSRSMLRNVSHSSFRKGFKALPSLQAHQKFFSSGKIGEDGDTDTDFQPTSKIKTTSEDKTEIFDFLRNAINSYDVLLFMKGSPKAPQCGFSARVVQILQNEKVDFHSADVLANHEIREAIKEFSDWPTIPQLYVKGDFVGGCDIVSEMVASGELTELLSPIAKAQLDANETTKVS